MKSITIKFGGSALSDVKSINEAANYVLNTSKHKRVTVVVSATKGTTDALLEVTNTAKTNHEKANQRLCDVFARHDDYAHSLLSDAEYQDWKAEITSFVENGKQHIISIHSNEHSDADVAHILSLGEKLSASIFSALIRHKGIASTWVRSELLIKTNVASLSAILDEDRTAAAFARLPKDFFENAIRIITGFCGSDIHGNTTLLGRNASDYSAAIVTAYATDELELIGDTGGILSADPDYVPGAVNIPSLTIEDASLLSQCGAGVLHPRTLYPLLKEHKAISLSCLSHESKTIIHQGKSEREQSYVAAWSPPENPRLSKRPPLPLFLKKWHAQTPELALVSVFLADQLAPKVWQQKLIRIAEKAEITIYQRKLVVHNRLLVFAVAKEDLQRFTRLVHSALYPVHQETAVAIIGASGRIGRQTLHLLLKESARLAADNGIQLRVVALCNSKQVLWCKRRETDVEALLERLNAEPAQTQPAAQLVKELLSQCYDKLVVVDASASQEIASLYEHFLEAGVAVVTPNKLASSDALSRFSSLHQLSRSKLTPYLYETTVAAALPVLRPLLDLRRAGDVPHRVEAVLSGTIAYVLDRIQQGIAFTTAVQEAVEKGYAEPDPLQDLSGEDVARKILILLRTCGVSVERAQIQLEALQQGSASGGIPNNADEYWKNLVEEAKLRNKRLCYCASYIDGNISVGLKQIDESSAFYRLRGTENAVIYQSLLYQDIPLTITGPGAGVGVTSAGVFADIVAAAEALARRAHLSSLAA